MTMNTTTFTGVIQNYHQSPFTVTARDGSKKPLLSFCLRNTDGWFRLGAVEIQYPVGTRVTFEASPKGQVRTLTPVQE